jgi:hypothetical protein
LVEEALYAAIYAREAADEASATSAPFDRRRLGVQSAGREAIRSGRSATQAVELDLPKGSAVEAVTAASAAISSGNAAIDATPSLPDDDGSKMAAGVTAAGAAATAAAAAAEKAAAHLDEMTTAGAPSG